MSPRPSVVLPAIVLSQFAGTSLWFAGNAVVGDLQARWGLPPETLGHVVSAVQVGFITGTLVFAFLAISDVFSPRVVYATCSVIGAGANGAVVLLDGNVTLLLLARVATGFFLAGIYPVGMKIAAGWYERGLGHALGLLVGALVIGTAFPHLLKGSLGQLDWRAVLLSVSAIAVCGGMCMYVLVPDGPYLTKTARFDPRAIAQIFRVREFRASSFGYFGHMWELYAFWTFVPWILHARISTASIDDIALWSFAIIAVGAIGCIGGGVASLKLGSARVAWAQLAASGLCCVLSPAAFHAPVPVFVAFLLFWGVVVVGDSPQFSALNAGSAPRHLVGSALTIANCAGFAITVVSIQLLNVAAGILPPAWLFVLLAPGPLLGLAALRPLVQGTTRGA